MIRSSLKAASLRHAEELRRFAPKSPEGDLIMIPNFKDAFRIGNQPVLRFAPKSPVGDLTMIPNFKDSFRIGNRPVAQNCPSREKGLFQVMALRMKVDQVQETTHGTQPSETAHREAMLLN